MLGNPAFPTYRRPPTWLPGLLVLAGLLMVAIGVYTVLSPEPGSCAGRGGLLCGVANKLALVLYSVENLKLAEASLFVASALLLWAFAWHLHTMWGRTR